VTKLTTIAPELRPTVDGWCPPVSRPLPGASGHFRPCTVCGRLKFGPGRCRDCPAEVTP
jgi:hypothetical protein